ncbi:MAG: hypothetical protein O8C61_12475 [Candidatus Methanoperedens sp.]|nr:hypothetical protein [Candidatus Methanoperedens sp.]
MVEYLRALKYPVISTIVVAIVFVSIRYVGRVLVSWMNNNPNLASSFAALFIPLITFFGVVFTLSQLRVMRRSRDLEFALQVIKEIRSEDWIKKFIRIYKIQEPSKIKEDIGLVNDVERVLDRLEWIGIMLERDSIPEDLTMKLIGGLPLRCWYKLSAYVEEKRSDRGHYARFVEEFAKRSLKFQIVHEPKEEWTKLEKKELVYELLKTNIIDSGELKYLKRKRYLLSMFDRKLKMTEEDWLNLQD